VRQNRADISVNRGAKKAKLLSPVSGVVTGINSRLREEGSLANKDPYTEGWVVRVHSDTLRGELKNLMIGGETQDFFTNEVDRLCQVIEEETGPSATDGGYLGNDIYGNLPRVGWERLTKMFLQT